MSAFVHCAAVSAALDLRGFSGTASSKRLQSNRRLGVRLAPRWRLPRSLGMPPPRSMRDDTTLDHHDLYLLLGVSSTATTEEIKQSYREAMKRCHPDVAVAAANNDELSAFNELAAFDEDDEALGPMEIVGWARAMDGMTGTMTNSSNNILKNARRDVFEKDAALTSSLLNRAWHVLKDANRRATYDSGRAMFGAIFSPFIANGTDPFTGKPRSQNAKPELPAALFVDEGLCIGCQGCAQAAPNTFQMVDELNVARVSTQWGDSESAIEDAVGCCPKNCIFTVKKAELPMLEWIHFNQPKQRVTLCSVESMSGKGKGLEESPFVAMERFERRRAELLRDSKSNSAKQQKQKEAQEALERVSNVVGWSRFFGGKKEGEGSSANNSVSKCPKTCPLPVTYVNPLLLPVYVDKKVRK